MRCRTLYDRLGGAPVVTRVCEGLYQRVLQDDRLADFFVGLDVAALTRKQEKFFRSLLGNGKGMGSFLWQVHQPLVAKRGLMHMHFDAMLELIDEVMADEGIDAFLRRQVMIRMEATRREILLSKMKKEQSMFSKVSGLIAGGVCYAVGMASLVVIGLWIGNIGLVTGMDAPREMGVMTATLINFGLIVLFGLQHSGMAMPGFKRAWIKMIPPHLERSVYVLASGIATVGLVYFWQPMGGTVWAAESNVAVAALYVGYALGWMLLVMSTFWINHFDLFGLRQVWLHFKGEDYSHIPFKTPGLYQYIRHPLYVGWFICGRRR